MPCFSNSWQATYLSGCYLFNSLISCNLLQNSFILKGYKEMIFSQFTELCSHRHYCSLRTFSSPQTGTSSVFALQSYLPALATTVGGCLFPSQQPGTELMSSMLLYGTVSTRNQKACPPPSVSLPKFRRAVIGDWFFSSVFHIKNVCPGLFSELCHQATLHACSFPRFKSALPTQGWGLAAV